MLTWRLITPRDIAQLEPGSAPASAGEIGAYRASCYEHGEDRKIPRNHVPRAYRLCLNSRVLATTQVRHLKDLNCLQVQSLLHEDDPQVARELLIFLFTEATRCSGQTELRFSSRRGGTAVPVPIPEVVQELARTCGVDLDEPKRGLLTSRDGLRLWLALTGFSKAANATIQRLEGVVSPARICFMVHYGIWSRMEMEMILTSMPHPETILTGEIDVEDHLLQAMAFSCSRAAILGGACERFLTRSSISHQERLERNGWVEPAEYDSQWDALIFRPGGMPLQLDAWLAGGRSAETGAVASLAALVRARDAAGVEARCDADVRAASELLEELGLAAAAVVYPQDYRWLAPGLRSQMEAAAAERHVHILVGPDTLAQIHPEARRRFQQASLVRS